VDFLAHPGVTLLITPDVSHSGDLAAFCAALSGQASHGGTCRAAVWVGRRAAVRRSHPCAPVERSCSYPVCANARVTLRQPADVPGVARQDQARHVGVDRIGDHQRVDRHLGVDVGVTVAGTQSAAQACLQDRGGLRLRLPSRRLSGCSSCTQPSSLDRSARHRLLLRAA
jgi:hypothetical protein